MDVRAGQQKRLSAKGLMPSNCGGREDSSESLGPQGDQKPVNPKGTLNIHWRTDAEAEAPVFWPPEAKN